MDPRTVSPWRLDDLQNVGHVVTETAKRMPDATAVAAPRRTRAQTIDYDQLTFGQLEAQSNQIAAGLIAAGIEPGTRMALMVPPGLDFVTHVFAMFKAGIVIILIDPGMGRKNMIRCLADAHPEGMVGIGLAQTARMLFRSRFPKCKRNFVVGHNRWLGCKSTKKFIGNESLTFQPLNVKREDAAAIIFTTGSTGPPKGVLYRHRIFIEQSQQIRDYFSIEPGSTDVSGFPLFALFNTAMGTTTVFPRMDPTRPADVHPPDIIDAVNRFDANQSFGSPALWNTVSNYCEQNNVVLPTVTRVLTAGAPVPPQVLRRVKKIISPQGDVYTPYGATESLPVACNSASVVLNETAERTNSGAGTCVGNRFSGITWRVIKISDEPIPTMNEVVEVGQGEIGELIVQGTVVTDQYVTRTDANADHKIKDGDSFWHRMGDVGYLDEADRFWFCGRKTHRVKTAEGDLFTIPYEAIVNTHDSIYRSALVGVGEPGAQLAVLIVEPLANHFPATVEDEATLVDQVYSLSQTHPRPLPIERGRILLHKKLPTDIRHNSKIFREQLRVWAAKELKA